MPSISLVRRTVFDSRGSGFWDPCFSCLFTKMSVSLPRAAINMTSANLRQIKTNILDSLLADTPAFAVGLLGFAVLTFFLLFKKVNLASLYLLSSILLTFFGAVIDLGQLYLRHAYTDSPSQRFIPSLVITREVLYSIASGLRFLFFWVYVSQPPLCEQDSARFLSIHSGSWLRWGTTGSFLRWTTLAASLSVSVLQILWRTVDVLRGFGPVYNIEGAMGITTSAIFIVKLLLNVSVVEVPLRRQTLCQYSSVMAALLINMGIGIGNLINFAFSEITLGRLLLAAEFHILVVSILVFAFYSTKTAEPPTCSSCSKRASSFRGLRVSFYDSDPALSNPSRASPIPSQPPSVQSVSSWPGRDARSRPPSQFGIMLNDGERLSAEKNERRLSASPSEKAVLSATGGMAPDSAQSTRWNGPIYPSSVIDSSVAYPVAPANSEVSSPALANQVSVGSVYDARKAPSQSVPEAAVMAAPFTGQDSPVLGSDDMNTPRKKSSRSSRPLQPLSSASFASSGVSNYDQLFRDQVELEMSIAALRGPAPTRSRSRVDRDTASDLPERGTTMTRESSTTGHGHTSTSGNSDFSLSIFPEPPQMPQSPQSAGNYRQSSSSILLPPMISIFTAGQGFPTSGRGSDDGATPEFGLHTPSSIGTRYDVTSFIGDLSSGDESLTQTPVQPWVSDSESEPGSAVQVTIVSIERQTSSRPRLVRSPSTITTRGKGPDSPPVREAATDTASPKQLSPISTLTVAPPPAIYTRGAAIRPLTIPTKRVVGLPSRPKMDNSPSADRQIGGVLDTPVPDPVPVVTQGS